MRLQFERRLVPLDSWRMVTVLTVGAVLLAFLICAMLFLPFTPNPFAAYGALLGESFSSLRGFGNMLNRAAPLILVALGTCIAWRAGFAYLGFDGSLVLGAATCTWFALAVVVPENAGAVFTGGFVLVALLLGFSTGGLWASGVSVLNSRFGGNVVLISLMSNYVAAFIVQYLVAGPLRAPGSQPQSERLPEPTWLPILIPETRAHIGFCIAVVCALLAWALLHRMRLGYDLIVTGLNPVAARYGGIDVGSRQLLAACLAGGIGALAGVVELLGSQHRLLDGLNGTVGFMGIVVALLARLNPLAVIPTAMLYAALALGGEALQRRTGAPSSIIAILQSLIVLLVLAADFLRHWRLTLRTTTPPVVVAHG